MDMFSVISYFYLFQKFLLKTKWLNQQEAILRM